MIEIMSPVGSYEALMAAIQAGAGSVYFGVGKMNMRSRSSANFTHEDLRNITQICAEHNVLSYLTVNTIIYNTEIEEVKDLLNLAKMCEVSAVIASDWSVISYCRKIGLEVHVSTQCNVTNIEAVKFYAQFADVVVLGREVILSQVADITKAIVEQDIRGPKGELVRVEMFVHGALCMAVSGKCYLSLDNFNYSANRGACLQPCRRGYIVKDIDHEIELAVENQYIMSPKDLCAIGFLDKIIKSGVAVLKIEGRGRSPEYVKVVTQCYHEALTAIQEGSYTKGKVDAWTKRLRSVYNRDFWDGYYLGRTMGEWSERYGSQATRVKEFVGKVTNYFGKLGVAEIQLESGEIAVGDNLLIMGPTTGVYEKNIDEIRVDLKSVRKAVKGDFLSITTDELVRRGDKVYKWVEISEEY
ncbi:U32 family peptidase [Bacteroidales bacterium OttesenSCG-928-B11]|nr:U32 family peptidase [Bacteroidales bacterium OttesenSCG-928-B11]